ncbi:hypothetical protein BN871_KP_00030, partial [Paenibacillus sp. P22]
QREAVELVFAEAADVLQQRLRGREQPVGGGGRRSLQRQQELESAAARLHASLEAVLADQRAQQHGQIPQRGFEAVSAILGGPLLKLQLPRQAEADAVLRDPSGQPDHSAGLILARDPPFLQLRDKLVLQPVVVLPPELGAEHESGDSGGGRIQIRRELRGSLPVIVGQRRSDRREQLAVTGNGPQEQAASAVQRQQKLAFPVAENAFALQPAEREIGKAGRTAGDRRQLRVMAIRFKEGIKDDLPSRIPMKQAKDGHNIAVLERQLLQAAGEALRKVPMGALTVDDERVDVLGDFREPHRMVENDDGEAMLLRQLEHLRGNLFDARPELENKSCGFLADKLAQIVETVLLGLLQPEAGRQNQVVPADERGYLHDFDDMHPADALAEAYLAGGEPGMGEQGTLKHVPDMQIGCFHSLRHLSGQSRHADGGKAARTV